MNQQLAGQAQHEINVNIVVIHQQGNYKMQGQIDPEIPFNTLINEIKEQIFPQRMISQYQDTIECQLGSGGQINQSETRSLQSLGFSANCTLYVKLQLKTG